MANLHQEQTGGYKSGKDLPHSKEKTGAVRPVVAVMGGVALTVLAVAAYRYFSNRAGEAAIQYIPADATMVATFDGTPSPRQIEAFAKIEGALNREGVSDLTADFIGKAVRGDAFAKDVKPYVSKNLAMAYWNDNTASQTDAAILLAISDPGAVKGALAKDARPADQDGLYRLGDGQAFAGVLDNYLLLTPNEARYNQIVKVSKGQLPSVAGLNSYKEARAALPSDSNLMVFVSPDLYKSMHVNMPSNAWVSMGAAVRNDGLAIACRFPAGADTLGTAPALDQAVLKEIPSGAYGVFAYSDATKWWSAAVKQDSKHALADFGGQMKTHTGLDLQRDVLPGLNGNMEVAVYPAHKEPQFLLMVDSEHGSNPVALAQKIQASIQAHEKDWGNAKVSQRQEGSATVWEIAGGNQNKPAVRNAAYPGNQPSPESPFQKVDLIAQNNMVYMTTGDDLTQRVLALGRGQGQSLAEDVPFQTMSRAIAPNSQSMLMVSLFRVLDSALKSANDKADANGIFGGPNTGVVGSCSYNASTGVGDLFIPLDWDKAIHWIGKGMKSMSDRSRPANLS